MGCFGSPKISVVRRFRISSTTQGKPRSSWIHKTSENYGGSFLVSWYGKIYSEVHRKLDLLSKKGRHKTSRIKQMSVTKLATTPLIIDKVGYITFSNENKHKSICICELCSFGIAKAVGNHRVDCRQVPFVQLLFKICICYTAAK